MPGQPALLIPLLFLLSDSQNHQPDLSDTALSPVPITKLSLPPDLLNMSHAILQISVLHVQWNLRFRRTSYRHIKSFVRNLVSDLAPQHTTAYNYNLFKRHNFVLLVIKLTNCHLIFEQLYNSKVNISIFFNNSKYYNIKELY